MSKDKSKSKPDPAVDPSAVSDSAARSDAHESPSSHAPNAGASKTPPQPPKATDPNTRRTKSNLFVRVEPLKGEQMDRKLMRVVEVTTNLNRVWVQTPEREKKRMPPFIFGSVSRVVRGAPINPVVNLHESMLPEIEAAVNELMPDSGPHRIAGIYGQTPKNSSPTIEIPIDLLE